MRSFAKMHRWRGNRVLLEMRRFILMEWWVFSKCCFCCSEIAFQKWTGTSKTHSDILPNTWGFKTFRDPECNSLEHIQDVQASRNIENHNPAACFDALDIPSEEESLSTGPLETSHNPSLEFFKQSLKAKSNRQKMQRKFSMFIFRFWLQVNPIFE